MMANTEAQNRATRNWKLRLIAAGKCSLGCGKIVKNQLNCFGKPRVTCVECVYLKNSKYKYHTKIQRMSKKIKEMNKIINLQHQVIMQLKEKTNGR